MKRYKCKRTDQISGLVCCLPVVIGITLFTVVPLIFSLVLSFGKLATFDLFDIEFIGFDNYVRIFSENEDFIKSIGNTFLYAVIAVGLSQVISLALANFLSKDLKGGKIFQIILFIPYVCSAVAISTMWRWIFDYNTGVLNDIMDILMLPRVDWLKTKGTAMGCLIFMSVWGGLGYNMILYRAALKNVNKTLYEAAELDGATAFDKFFRITIPCITPTMFFLLLMGFVGALQSFANFQIMTPYGGPDGSTYTMVLCVYNYTFLGDPFNYGMGYGAAMSWLVGIIVMIFSAIYFKLSRRWVSYD